MLGSIILWFVGVIFFTDPLSPHPHTADISTLLRMCDIHNILHATNPTTANSLIHVLDKGSEGEVELLPSFFHTLTCPHASIVKPCHAPLRKASGVA